MNNILDRQERALNLRKTGKTYREIGEILGRVSDNKPIGVERARQLVKKAERHNARKDIWNDFCEMAAYVDRFVRREGSHIALRSKDLTESQDWKKMIPWGRFDDTAKYIAMDSDFRWHVFQKKPEKIFYERDEMLKSLPPSGEWKSTGGKLEQFDSVMLGSAGICHTIIDWQDSLASTSFAP